MVSTLLLVAGYPVAVVVIARWVPVVRDGRIRWFAAHTVAVAAIIVGWAMRGRWPTVGVNAAWLLVSAAWYFGARRGTPPG